MGIEWMSIPEASLQEVILVIRAGLKTVTISEAVRDSLEDWCDAEQEYLQRIEDDDRHG